MKKIFLFLFLNAFMSIGLFANNIQVSGTTILAVDVPSQTAYIQFTLTWDNSWRTDQYESNYDAAWVFVKYRFNYGGPWRHLMIKNIPPVFTPTGYGDGIVERPSDGVGAFIYRDVANLGGPATFGGQISLAMDLAGTNLATSDGFKICVEAIEMVYVPTGAFFLGHGPQTLNEGGVWGKADDPTVPFEVTSENPIVLGGTAPVNLYFQPLQVPRSVSYSPGNPQTLPAAFPKGYNQFYCMKYEISQGQFAEFLKKTGYVWDPVPPLFENSIINGEAAIPDRACNYISSLDGLYYADWSGLRPMTELEFEKACRGTKIPVPHEYAWGNPEISGDSLLITAPGTPSEGISNVPLSNTEGFASYYSNLVVHTLRCGAIASSFTAPVSRANAGATYYGIMEMSGNLGEFCVTVDDNTTWGFIGTHGDGNIQFLPDHWDIVVGGGLMYRGGYSLTSPAYINQLRISDRTMYGFGIERDYTVGFRCVRTGGL